MSTTPSHKRVRLENAEEIPPLTSSNSTFSTTSPLGIYNHSSTSSFRNVSACNRCRLRKNRCDQNLPACTSCDKAGVRCVGFDPITKREIPRTYVYYLESRVRYLEELLHENDIQYAPSHDFHLGAIPVQDVSTAQSPVSEGSCTTHNTTQRNIIKRERAKTTSESGSELAQKQDESDKLHQLVSNIGMVSVQGASDPRFLGSTSGISFARVVFAAVKSSVSGNSSDTSGGRGSKRGSVGSAAAVGGTSMRDSFFGLQSKPNMKPAPFPDRELGLALVNLYFEHANPQIPILHRPEFMQLFGRAYASKDRRRSARELYLLNIVFAIGAGTMLEDSHGTSLPSAGIRSTEPVRQEPASPNPKKPKPSSQQRQPEEYHASAMMHLESFLGSMPVADRPEGLSGGLEQLQAVLLLAGFALLRPVAPGLWYITGVAVRLGIDLGLHYEDGAGVDSGTEDIGSTSRRDASGKADDLSSASPAGIGSKERGRREWVRDLRRRLWWCVYSFDRLVSTCVGRPFGITDAVITTDWPSPLDDQDITPEGFLIPSHNFKGPSYKRVSYHYFRLRLLQSEILQVLQYRQAQRVHEKDRNYSNQYMHTKLCSAFLEPFDSFQAWRKDIDRRLWEWKESAPLQEDTTVRFSVKFLELNYWQAVIMLYRQSLSVPDDLAGEAGPHKDVESPITPNDEEHEHEDDIFLKVAEAGQRVLKLYRSLHRARLVNYTYLATVHLFMAGIAFLYSIWHSATVRSRLTLDDVDLTVLAATSVLTDLIHKCPPAEACRDAFDRMSKATIKMCLSTTGFGSQVRFARTQDDSPIVSPQFERTLPPPRGITSISMPSVPQRQREWIESFPGNPLTSSNGNIDTGGLDPWQTPPATNSLSSMQPQPFSVPDDSFVPTYDSPSSLQTGQQYDSSVPPNSQPSLFDKDARTDTYEYNVFDFDTLMTNDSLATAIPLTGDSGLNLGFDAHHDWADGGNAQFPDLFGGFFFGGSTEEGGEIDVPAAFPTVTSEIGDQNGMTTMWSGG